MIGVARSVLVAWALGSALSLAVQASSQQEARPSYRPLQGFVPDASTAIAIGEAVLIPIYGKKQVKAERPFVASLRDGIWTVSGYMPPNMMGGVAIVEIAKQDGRIISVIHEK